MQEKKEFFQGIDEAFSYRVIENGRDEDVCRQRDALADEDHLHHLTPQEYYLYNSNWWLHSNKTGFNTVLVEHRSGFKQALSTLQQSREREAGAQRKSTMGTEFFFFMVELARFMVDSFFL